MKTLLLAAGKSTRIASISKGLPKPLIPFRGRSVIQRNISWLVEQKIFEIWINLHYLPETIMDHLGDGSSLGVKINYAFEPNILGTAGAIKSIYSESDSTCLVLCGDNLYHFSLSSFLDFHRAHKASLSIALFDQRKHLHTGIAGGRALLQDDEIKQFVEKNSSFESPYVNAGVYLLERDIINQIPENRFYDFGNDLFQKCINNNIKIHGHIIDGYCLGIDTPESYYKALEIFP